MEPNLYKIMQELKEQKGTENNSDVRFLGTIVLDKETPNGNIQIAKDIIAITDTMQDGSTATKFYDENQTLLAVRGADGELYPSQEFMYDDLGFLSEIDAISNEQGISFDEIDAELERMSKYLGIDKKDILAMSEVDLDTALEDRNNPGLDLSNDDNGLDTDEKKKQNEAALNSIDVKQEINLDNKVDNRHTLAEILDVPAGSKLSVVASDKIQDNNNSTRFSCVIKTPDGELQPADMLNQVGGKDSNKNVYETDRDGNVSKQNIQSSFAIDSPVTDNAIITIRRGQMGTIKVGYGLTDPTSHRDVFSEDLETSETYPVTSRVRDEFSAKHGVYNVTDKMDEIEEHEAHGERKMSLAEADGRPETGHIHGEEAAEIILADDEFVNNTNDIYSAKDIAERFESIREKNHGLDRNELIEATKRDLEEDAEHMPGIERNR